MEELTEVITAAEFHPKECNLFVYSSSKGIIRLCDMRQSALCDTQAKGMICLSCQLIFERIKKQKLEIPQKFSRSERTRLQRTSSPRS